MNVLLENFLDGYKKEKEIMLKELDDNFIAADTEAVKAVNKLNDAILALGRSFDSHDGMAEIRAGQTALASTDVNTAYSKLGLVVRENHFRVASFMKKYTALARNYGNEGYEALRRIVLDYPAKPVADRNTVITDESNHKIRVADEDRGLNL